MKSYPCLLDDPMLLDALQYLNNIIEADHGKLKRLIKPTLGFKSLKTAYATIKGFEAMRTLKKKQEGLHRLLEGVKGEVRLVERCFYLGNTVLARCNGAIKISDGKRSSSLPNLLSSF